MKYNVDTHIQTRNFLKIIIFGILGSRYVYKCQELEIQNLGVKHKRKYSKTLEIYTKPNVKTAKTIEEWSKIPKNDIKIQRKP